MSNVKISQLPEYTGNTSGSWLVMNDSGETTTYKVERETFLSGYAPSGDYATTGSNLFKGDQTISGSITLSNTSNTNIYFNSGSGIGSFLSYNQTLNGAGGTLSVNTNGSRGLISVGASGVLGSSLLLNKNTGVTKLYGSSSISLEGVKVDITGSVGITGSLEINNTIGYNGTGNKYLYFTTSSTGPQINYSPVGTGILGLAPGVSGSVYIGTTSAGNNTLFGDTRLTGSAHRITGSLGVSGSTTINGNTTITGSLSVSGSVGGANVLNLTGSVGIKNGFFNIRNEDDSTAFQYTSIANSNTLLLATTATGSSNSTLTLSTRNTPSDVFNSISFNKDSGSFQMRDLGFPGGSPVTILKINNNISGSNPPVEFKRNVEITGSLNVSGSIIQTGSVQGNVLPLSISSNTASLNLDNGNYFTLQLVSGSATHLNPSNIKPGQTVSVFVNTTGSATMTFPSSIKQISGSSYIPTTTTGLDVLTLISSDSSNLYLVSAKTFI